MASSIEEAAARYRGVVEHIRGEQGVIGWVVDTRNPALSVSVELLLDGRPIASTTTGLPRRDVEDALGIYCRPGFGFSLETISILVNLPVHYHDMTISVRVGGDYELPLTGHNERAGHWSELLRYGSDTNLTRSELMLRLHELREHAGESFERIGSQIFSGHVEAAMVDRNGLVWLVGWAHSMETTESSIRIIDGETYNAGLILAQYTRPDLENLTPPSYGFVGLLSTDWRPTEQSDAKLEFSPGNYVLRSNSPLSIHQEARFWSEFGAVPLMGQYAFAIKNYAKAPELVTTGTASDVTANVEELLLVPGFGCVATGWILSPHRELRSIAIRVGFQVAECDRGTLYRSSREDLKSILPKSPNLVRRAGFTGVFQNPRLRQSPGPCSLLLRFSDGTSTTIPVDPKSVVMVGHSVNADTVMRFYPALAEEAFFPAFARAVRHITCRKPPVIQPFEIAKTERPVVLVVPSDRSEMARFFDQLLEAAPTIPPSGGLALLADGTESRAYVVSLFRSLKDILPQSSLFFIEGDTPTLALPDVLSQLGADVFAFANSTVRFSRSGWKAVAETLSTGYRDLQVLELVDPVDDHPFTPTTDCFTWNTLDYLIWKQTARTLIGFVHGIDDLPVASESAIVPGAGYRAARQEQPPLIAAINAVA